MLLPLSVSCVTYEHYSSECICLLHRPCKTAVTPATLRRGGARGRWTTGTRRTPAPTRTRYVHIKDLLLTEAHHVFLGRPQGIGPPLEHPCLVAKHDVWRRRRRPIDAQPGNPQQISSWHRHFKLHAFQPSVHTKGVVLYSTLYIGYAIFTNTELLSTSFGAISRWC